MKSNAELFAEAVHAALAPQDTAPTPDTPTGPRKPAPVPEVGVANAPKRSTAEQFAELMGDKLNRVG